MARIHKNKPLLPKKMERRSVSRSHSCLRTECLVSAILVGFLAMFVTCGSSSIVKAGYELVQERSCLTKIEKQNEILRLEIAGLKSPQRIKDIAVGQLGMINPPTVYIAAKGSTNGMPVKEGTLETAAVQQSVLFGNARAEAHVRQQ